MLRRVALWIVKHRWSWRELLSKWETQAHKRSGMMCSAPGIRPVSITLRPHSKYGFRIKYASVSQDHLINDVTALDAAESPKSAMPAVALKIGAHLLDHMPVAPGAVLLSGHMSGGPRCRWKHGGHVNLLLSMVSLLFVRWTRHAICVLYCRRRCFCPGNLPSLNNPSALAHVLSKRIGQTTDLLNFPRREGKSLRRTWICQKVKVIIRSQSVKSSLRRTRSELEHIYPTL